MPGTPYLEQPPQGLMTWPKLLKIGLPITQYLQQHHGGMMFY